METCRRGNEKPWGESSKQQRDRVERNALTISTPWGGRVWRLDQRKVASNAATATLPPSTTPASTREMTRGGVI
jgi:hypothetical protein